jgi:hypothetical protein
LGTLVLFVLAVDARAGFIPRFTGTSPAGANTAYNYVLLFSTTVFDTTAEERLEAGSGLLNPGVIGSQDFVTLYDVGFAGPGDGANFITATPGPNFTANVANTGTNAAQTLPFDNPFLSNVTFRYTGPNISADTVFPGFSIIVSNNDGVSLKQYTSQRTDNLGDEINTKISELGIIAVPVTNVIPEPATVVLAALGGLAFVAVRRIRR